MSNSVSQKTVNGKFINEYKRAIFRRLELAGISRTLIDNKKLDLLISEKFINKDIDVYNNIKNESLETNLLELTELTLFSKKAPILTAFNTLFYPQDQVTNIPSGFLDFLKANRDIAKAEMYTHINDADSSLYDSFNFVQLVFKLIANSYYGAFGMKAFHFFNAFLGPSVTSQGRQLISASILAFEGFLGDNIRFPDIDGLSYYLDNILSEEFDEEMLVEPKVEITEELVIKRLVSLCEFDLSENELEYIEMLVSDRPSTVLQKLYYKNNFYEFFEIDELKEAVKEHLIVDGFHDVNEPPEQIVDALMEVSDIIRYFVSYPYLYENKTDLVNEINRESVLICDTDSTFLHVNRWLEFVCGLMDYDITTITKDQRVSIITVVTFFTTQFIAETFKIFCENSNVPESEFYRINMKSEFHYRRVVLTKNKKSYAGLILAKEGKVYDTPKFDLKGLSVKKVSTPKAARVFFSNLLETKILNSPNIDIKEIYNMYHSYTNEIEETVKDGKPTYLKAGTMKSMDMYKMPYTLQSVRAALLWNALYGNSNFIPDFSTFKILSLDELKIPSVIYDTGEKELNYPALYTELPELAEEVDGLSNEELSEAIKTDKRLKQFLVPIYEDNPKFKEFLLENFDETISESIDKLFEEHPGLKQYGITVLAVPTNVNEIPKDFLEFTNVPEITNAVMKKGNILLESLGFILVSSRNRSIVSNMLKI